MRVVDANIKVDVLNAVVKVDIINVVVEDNLYAEDTCNFKGRKTLSKKLNPQFRNHVFKNIR